MVILYILLVLVLVIIARTLMFTPKAEEPRTYEEIDPDRRAAEDRLSALVRCRTVSYEDASLEDGAEFEKLINILKRNNTIFHTGYMYRYNPYILELLEEVRNGELVDILSVEAQMS